MSEITIDNTQIEQVRNVLDVSLNMGLAGTLVALIITAIGFVRVAFPEFPTKFIPLITWILATIAYPVILGDFSRTGWIAGIITGIIATGTHSGLINPIKNSEPLQNKVSEIRNRFGKDSQTNKNI